MKRIFSILMIAVCTTGFMYAQEAAPADGGSQDGQSGQSGQSGASSKENEPDYLLIDFEQLHTANTDVDYKMSAEGGKQAPGYELPQFDNLPGQIYSDKDLENMAINLKLHNWIVDLSKSSQSALNNNLSKTRAVTSNSRGTVLGVRAHFPELPISGYAFVKPPFDIPVTYGDHGQIKSLTDLQTSLGLSDDLKKTGLGILHNVGNIRSLSVEVFGRNYPNGLSVVLEDAFGNETETFMGYLNFRGWRVLKWENPNYIEDVRERRAKVNPLYPNQIPLVRFKGFKIYRNAKDAGGDFIGYFNKVNLIYDRAQIPLEEDDDIADEDFWYIVTKYTIEKAYKELVKLAEVRYEQYIQGRQTYDGKSVKRGGDEKNPETAEKDKVSNNSADNGREGSGGGAKSGSTEPAPAS